MLKNTYFHAELVQLTVSRSDSELEVQRYAVKKNTLTVDPIMLEMNCEWDNVNKKLSYRRETARQLRIRSWRAVSLR